MMPMLQDLEITSASPPAFEVMRGQGEGVGRSNPVIFASPHSGRFYPADMRAAVDGLDLRRSEDALVDQLISAAPGLSIPLIQAHVGRAYLDVNRDCRDLDPDMFEVPLSDLLVQASPHVAAGFGIIARHVGQGQALYARKLTLAEAQARIDYVYRPYHAALQTLIDEALAHHRCAILIDWHSMPARAVAGPSASRACDFVLGDRFGMACDIRLTRFVESELEAMGYRVQRNLPYAGGHTTARYGKPGQGINALQVEINRALYLDEDRITPNSGFDDLKADLETLTKRLASNAWLDLKRAPVQSG